MIYIYTKPMCSACIDLKNRYKEEGIEFIERNGDRLKAPSEDRDEIDVDALVEFSISNMTFPVQVKVGM
jgi:glutaredoxin